MRNIIFAAGILGMLLYSVALAEIVMMGFGPPAEVRIRIGAETGITTVAHDVPLSMNGDGKPISGVPAGVIIEVSARRATAREMNHTYYVLTVDSSVPLSSGLSTIPFTEISWTSQDGDILDGRFDGTSSQVILSPTRAKYLVRDFLTFFYDNDLPVAGGIYTGTVTYRVSIP